MPDEKISSALNKAADALEAVYETIAGLDPNTLTTDTWLEARAKVGRLLAQFDAAGNRVSKALGVSSAEARLLRYLQANRGRVIDKDSLSGVSGIYEWARRLRELRLEQGWAIDSNETRDDLKPGQYVLEGDAPDAALANVWQTANRIRRTPGGAKTRVITYLREIYPASADKKQLAYVANIQEWPRRMRELEEEGHQIVSAVDDPTLAPGEYRLAGLDLLPPRKRQAIKIRQRVMARDKFECKDCGWAPGRPGQPRPLQIHHTEDRSISDDDDKLVTLCSDCHAGRHAVERGTTGDELKDPSSDPYLKKKS